MTSSDRLFPWVACGVLVAGVFLAWPELLVIGCVSLAAWIVSMLGTLSARGEITHASMGPQQVVRRSTSGLEFSVSANRRRGLRILNIRDGVEYRVGRLASTHGPVAFSFPIDTSNRREGIEGPFELRLAGLLGLRIVRLAAVPAVDVRVVPRFSDRYTTSRIEVESPGDEETTGLGGGAELSEVLEEYRHGDDPRRINWNATARTGQLLVRRALSPQPASILVVLDVDEQSYTTPGKVERLETIIDRFETVLEEVATFLRDRSSRACSLFLATTDECVPVPLLGSSPSQLIGPLARPQLCPRTDSRFSNLDSVARNAGCGHVVIFTHRLQGRLEDAVRTSMHRVVVNETVIVA